MGTRICPGCGRAGESASACAFCGSHHAEDHSGAGTTEPDAVPLPFESDDQRASGSAAGESLPVLPPPPGPPLGPRELVMGLLGVAGGGFLILTFMFARGAASPEASPAQPHASTRSAPGAPAAAQRIASPGWSSNRAAWVGTARNSAAFELPATSKIQVWMKQVQPVLVVRCRRGAAEVFVFTDSPAQMEPQDGDHTVRLSFDGGPETRERWPDSAEHDALFAPDGPEFLSRLVEARTLRFGFSPHNSTPVVASFEVGGLADHLTAAAKPCGWKTRGS